MATVGLTTNFNDGDISALPDDSTRVGSPSATATITFTGDVVADETIQITDALGVSRQYIAKGSNGAASLEFIKTQGSHASATGLAAAIVHANGHAGSIKCDRTNSVIVLTQRTAGPGGNTIIVNGLSAGTLGTNTVTNFTGAVNNPGVDSLGNTLPETGGEINAGEITSNSFVGAVSAQPQKGFGREGATEARHSRLRNLGII
jgi:hypothetical protein